MILKQPFRADGQEAMEDPIHILVVDDEPAAQRLMSRILEKRGYRTSTASDVTSAMRVLGQDEVTVVMTDLDMPGGSGLELIAMLQADHPDVATILVTGRGNLEVASRAVMTGAYGYLSKPFLQDEVEITILNALRRRELELQSRRHQEDLERTVRERTSELMESLSGLQAAQDELQRRADQLLELDRMKAQFIQVVSHELRTPLTVIRGGVQTVLRAGDAVDPSLREQLLRSVESNVDELGRMINKLLMANSIGRGSKPVTRDPIVLDELAREVVDLMGRPHRDRFRLRLTPSPALGASGPIRDALRDLVENALVHTEGPVTIATWQAGDEATASVSDEGSGIERELLDRLLSEPFVQGDSSTTRNVGGLGLSLYLARRVAEASGGRFQVESSASGSIFSIVLPAAPS